MDNPPSSNDNSRVSGLQRKISFEGDFNTEIQKVKLNKDSIKFTMFYDQEDERFIIHEYTYEL